jgi:hypothetical protein
VRVRYGWDRVAADTERVYDRVVDERAASATGTDHLAVAR